MKLDRPFLISIGIVYALVGSFNGCATPKDQALATALIAAGAVLFMLGLATTNTK